MPWHHRKYGSATDPIHKSHLKQLSGEYSCPRRFQFERNAPPEVERDSVSGKAAAGTAAHETIARALTHADFAARLLRGDDPVPRAAVKAVFWDEYEREVGARRVEWYGDRDSEVLDERVDMVTGLLNALHMHVAEFVLVEPAFVAPLGGYWLAGHIDLVYRPRVAPHTLAICDWKTGASKPHPIELDHSWEAGVYSVGLRDGWFLPRRVVMCTAADGGVIATVGERQVWHASRYLAERQALELALIDIACNAEAGVTPEAYAMRFDVFPSSVHYVHLGDYVPYEKAGVKAVKRREDLDYYGYAEPVAKHRYVAGQQRGPAWLPVQLTEHDVPRLAARLRNVIGMVRMGRFIDQISEQCSRCHWAKPCLTEGYGPRADERADLERLLRAIPGAEDDAAALGD